MIHTQSLAQKKHRLVILLLVLLIGSFAYLFLSGGSVEARCPANPRDCGPAGPQGPVGGSGGGPDSASGAPGIKSCEADDIKDTKKCKKAYRKCDEEKNKKKRIQCKKDVIKDHKKKDSGGGDAKDPPGIGKSGEFVCGTHVSEDNNVNTIFDFGCLGTDFAKLENGEKDASPIKNISPILDLTYAVVRFLSIGVGVVIAISIIMSGIQYTMSEGNAEVTQKAKARIRSAILGLGIYIFVFSMMQFLVPGGIFRPGMWMDESTLQLIPRLYIWIF